MTWTIGTAILLVGFAAGWVAHGLTFNNRREKRWSAFEMDKAKVGEASRQFGANLQDQMYRTQLAHKELMLKQEAFNADMNFNGRQNEDTEIIRGPAGHPGHGAARGRESLDG